VSHVSSRFQQEIVCSLHSFRYIVQYDATPAIAKLSTWTKPNTVWYNETSQFLNKWPHLRCIEFICDHFALKLPTDDVLKWHGNQLFIRAHGEEYAIFTKLE